MTFFIVQYFLLYFYIFKRYLFLSFLPDSRINCPIFNLSFSSISFPSFCFVPFFIFPSFPLYHHVLPDFIISFLPSLFPSYFSIFLLSFSWTLPVHLTGYAGSRDSLYVILRTSVPRYLNSHAGLWGEVLSTTTRRAKFHYPSW